MTAKIRLDVYLVEMGLANSRTHAQELIEAGQVYTLENQLKKVFKKPSVLVDKETATIAVEMGPANRYVSRGGLKLEGALAHVGLSVKGLRALDVGLSTGGFTDCLLQSGVDFVLGVDVGHGQTHPRLLQESRLHILEGINARSIDSNTEVLEVAKNHDGFDLIVMDVSFISISLIIPALSSLLKSGGHVLSLVKPQFEVGVDGLAKGGIVKDTSLFVEVEKKVRECCQQSGFTVLDYFSSPIEGKDGNSEFFVFCRK
jgi:23S rRNA (cytidine1920-2'-O)/16S rRNA (cytidine1409-2'-O)-methyltransferase